jgi:hypothetical protein
MVYNDKDKCIICMEYCSYKLCECNAFMHLHCFLKWNNSIYNINQSTCPHCKKPVHINEKKKYHKIIYIYLCNFISNIIQYFKSFILSSIKFMKDLGIMLFNILIFIVFCIIIPDIVGIILFSLYYLYNKDNIQITYVDYIVNNMIMTWFIGFLTMITIVHIWVRRKTGDCRLGDDW